MLGGTGRFTVTGGRSFHNRGSGPVSVNLGYHGEFGKTVESNDIRGTLKVRF